MQNLVFPSGLSVQRAKKRAKELVKTKQAKNQSDALDAISLKEVNKPWALAMAQLQQNSNYLITLADIEKILEREPLLIADGFGHADNYHESFYKRRTFHDSKTEYIEYFHKSRELLRNSIDQCQRCCMYLQHLKKLKSTRYHLGSYGLKHSVEKYHRQLNQFNDAYVSNGAFICAAIHMGFSIMRKDHLDPNAWIFASLQSDIIVWERLLEQQNSYRHFTEQNLFKKVSKSIGLFSDEAI
ncbi:hypothetical protein [Acinetobacter baumannii]|uniref:hypothetical protein n=1 Tax=Acinetobacter baumannii TaxID=470 RepID=UPI001C0D3E59|nr:hypothetical protein [Acinetobacter baumannii]MBU3167814.1 hypothetical protein [Acinetobacter baumannii]MDC4275227.1 hypothetical protein [Acinetobacter baumannii]MDC4399511.1 hypothetical protein [Acinetobacter baumannii]MDC4867885.1 hypothetical protein [Acinetobacter baumannii]MDC5380362.1 hypothetical protein [Acinetobacter baumannii]